jgi:hypothetical protein
MQRKQLLGNLQKEHRHENINFSVSSTMRKLLQQSTIRDLFCGIGKWITLLFINKRFLTIRQCPQRPHKICGNVERIKTT